MNRRDLVAAVANHTGRDRKDVDEVLKGFTDVVTTVVSKGEPVAISGFAKFVKVDRPARMGRNPQTGEPVRIKASKKARITALKAFKDAVMSPSTAPKLAKGTWPPAPAGAKAATKATKATKTSKTTAKAPAKATAKKATAKKAAAKKTAATRKTTATRKSAAKRAPATKTTARKR
ncbi:MAG TPA: HU family DNA-binding protein [Acidimicrobiales bacterium]